MKWNNKYFNINKPYLSDNNPGYCTVNVSLTKEGTRYINRLKNICKITTFLESIFKTQIKPLRKYIEKCLA